MPFNQTGPNASTYVVKLTGGTGVAWTTPITAAGTLLDYASIAADAQGRAYVAGLIGPPYTNSAVVRLNAAGTAIDYTSPVPGQTSAIAVDGSGNAFVVGNPSPYLARIAPDGSTGFNTPLPQLKSVGSVALDPKGNPVVLGVAADGSGLLLRFDSTGAITLSETIASPTAAAGGFSLAVDASGNAYVTGSTYIYDSGTPLLPVKNTILGCASAEWLSVFAPNGSLLQTTYSRPGTKVRFSHRRLPSARIPLSFWSIPPVRRSGPHKPVRSNQWCRCITCGAFRRTPTPRRSRWLVWEARSTI